MLLLKPKRKEVLVVPKPGSPVRGSGSGRPIMATLDLLGRRWILRVVWELSQQPAGFRELQRRCDDMSSSVLATRLRELTEAQIVSSEDGIYQLSSLGTRLVTSIQPLLAWSTEWAAVTASQASQ